MMKKLLCLFILALSGMTLHAYKPIQQWMIFKGNYSFMNNKVDMNKNLSGSDAVTAIAADAKGNVYLAVSNVGLMLFDGQNLKKLASPKGSFAATAPILSLAMDSKDVLWIGTSEGLVKYDGTEWVNIGPEATDLRAITGIAITATDKVYVAGFSSDGKDFNGGGLSFYNGSGWEHYNRTNTALPDDTLQDLTIDNKGYLWMTAGNHHAGIVRFDGKNWKHFHTGNTSELPTNNVAAIANSKNGLWFATTKGLLTWNGTAFSFKPYSNGFGRKFSNYLNADGSLDLSALAVEDNGAIWLGTSNKGVIFVHDKLTKNYTVANSLLNSDAVSKIWIDKDHREWFLTGSWNADWLRTYPKNHNVNYLYNTGGITVLKENSRVADPNWTIYTDNNTDLTLGTTFSISEDKTGNIWMPTTGDGLIKIKDGDFTVYKPAGALTALTKAYLADDGKIYLGTTMKGIKVFEDGEIKDFLKWPNMGGANDMALDKDHVFWVTGTGGVSRWINNDWETFNKKHGDLPTVIFYCLLKDSKGMLWVGSAKGLMKYDGTAWQVISKKEVPFPSDDITALAEDKDGKLWVGTKAGLSIFDGANWTHFSKIESPKINKFQVNGISFDTKGNAWLATEQDGLLKYDGSTWKQFNKEATGATFDKVFAVKAGSDGKIYFMSGFDQFNDFDVPMPSQSAEYNIQKELDTRMKAADPKYIFAIVNGL
jgi:ligand-binding sensor domain-containing protein